MAHLSIDPIRASSWRMYLWATGICVLSAFATSALFAEEGLSPQEVEAKQFDEEEKAALAETGKPHLAFEDYTGKFTLFTEEQMQANGDTTVVGKFESEKAAWLVKPMSEEVKKQLTAVAGKTCTVSAKLRNNNKYMYVQKVVPSGSENTFTKRRGGL
jgi:hypothetical protein